MIYCMCVKGNVCDWTVGVKRNIQYILLPHEGQWGVVMTKQHLRSKVWQQGTEWTAERNVKFCHLGLTWRANSFIRWAETRSGGKVGVVQISLCFKTSVFSVHSQHGHIQNILEHFMLPSADQLHRSVGFIFPVGLGTCPHCQRYQNLVHWTWHYCAWLAANWTDLNPSWEEKTLDPTIQVT